MQSVGFLGLGKMGLGMASRLIAAGHAVRVFNRTRARAELLTELGAIVCASPAEACTGADAVFSMTADDASSREVWCGPSGVFAGAPAPRAFAVECSTLSHAWVLELSGRARERGLRYIDAPVTGLPDAAAAGELTLLVGASEVDLAAARALLAPLCERILRFGEVGAGTAYKLAINMLGAVQIASAAEAMALLERAGLDLGEVADAIALGQAASPQVVRNTRRMVARDHDRDVVFTPALRLKDVEYALRFAHGLGVDAPFGALSASLFRESRARGDADANESVIFEVARARRPNDGS